MKEQPTFKDLYENVSHEVEPVANNLNKSYISGTPIRRRYRATPPLFLSNK